MNLISTPATSTSNPRNQQHRPSRTAKTFSWPAKLLVACFVSLLLPGYINPQGKLVRDVKTASYTPRCKQQTASLSQSEKETLLRESAIRKGGIGWILSESLVSDCQTRLEMAAYFGRVIGGTSKEHQDDRKFAADNSKEIVRVLRQLWPSLGNSKALVLMADGAFDSEKYALLSEPAFEPDVIAPLISDILAKEGISSDLAFVLLSRPMPNVKAAISRQLTLAEGKGDVREQIYALVVLHRLGEPTALPKLKELSENKNLSTFEKKLLAALVAKIRRGQDLEFSDIEDLEYVNDRPLYFTKEPRRVTK